MANYYELVTDEVLETHNALKADASTWGTDTQSRMETLAAAQETALSALQGETFVPSYTYNLLYVPPTAATAPNYSALGPAAFPELADLGDTAIPAFSFSETRYTGQLKNQMKTGLLKAIAGKVPFLPDTVFDALYDRMISDLQANYVTGLWAASDHGAAMGWVLPSETTLAATASATDEYTKSVAKARNEAFVKEWLLKHEDMWKGMAQGTEFEKLWLEEHNSYHARALDAAGKRVQYAIDINEELMKRNDQLIAAYAEEWKGLAIRLGAETDRFKALIANVGAAIQSEATRLGFEGKKSDLDLADEQGKTTLRVEEAKIIVESTLGTLTKLTEVTSNVAMSLMSASDVSLGTGTSFGTSESHSYAEKCCEDA